MSAIVEVVAVNLFDSEPKRIVKKLTPEEIVRRKAYALHIEKFEKVLINIRLRPYTKDPEFHNGRWDQLMTWLCEDCDSNKYSDFYGLQWEDFVFTRSEGDDDYIIQTRNSINTFHIKETDELDEIMKRNLIETITDYDAEIIYSNLKDDARRCKILEKNYKPDNAPSYDSVNCPVCFCDFVSVEEEGDFLYNKATGKIPKDDDRVARIDTCCGHLLCVGCFNDVRNKGNRKCPTCRAVLDCWDEDSDEEYEERRFTFKDIEELIYQEDGKELTRITDLNQLRYDIIERDGCDTLSGYDNVYEYAGIYICEF